MKKIILTLLMILAVNLSCTAEEKLKVDVVPHNNYLLLLSKGAETSASSNKDVAEAKILTTIYNERTQLIIKVLKEGNAKLFIETKDDVIVLDINSDKKNMILCPVKYSKNIKDFLKLDTPYIPKVKTLKKEFELDAPPPLGGN